MENLVKIVFCGAPSSGKSASLQRLKINPHPEWNVRKTIEAASFIMQNSELHPKSDPYSFQQVVSLLQLALENSVIESNAQKRHLLLLCDRGIADAFVYVGERAEGLLHQTVDECLRQYKHVIYFEPYAADQNDLKNNNAFRYETKSEIQQMATRTLAVWERHDSFYRIPNFATLDEKAAHVAQVLNQILGVDLFYT